ncbi:MAG: formyltetrahydrofolate deformylase, partial [Leptospiraceae bacterium]|nr:formyltetrahydrofolate deformylase [Leptospiraceae bacterium]
MQHYILRIVCPDRKGLIFNTMKILLKYDSNILENEEFVDESNSTFFMRTEFILDGNVLELRKELELFFQDAIKLEFFPKQKKKLWVLVTKEHHCLSDILIRSFHGDWNSIVKGVISNHVTLRAFSEMLGYNYYYVSHENKTREEMERDIASIIDTQGEFDYIILAKYM